MSKIKVAVLVNEFFSNSLPFYSGKGGYGMIARHYLAEYIPNQEIEIDTIAGYNDEDELLVHIVDNKKRVLFLPRTKEKILEIIKDYDIFLSIEFQNIAFDIMSLLKYSNKKLILWIQDPRPLSGWKVIDQMNLIKMPGYRPDKSVQNLMNFLYKNNRLIGITQGKYMTGLAQELYDLPKEFNAKWVPNAVELPKKGSINLIHKKPVILCLARISAQKRPWLIGEIAKQLPEYEFRILGQYNDSDTEIRRIMDKYKKLSNLIFCGETEGKEKNAQMREAKLLLNTAIWEGIPVSFLESLSYGMPIVSSVNPEQLTSKFGYYTGEIKGDGFDSVDKFVKGIKKFMENEQYRIKTAQEGVKYVDRYHTVANFTKNIRRVIKENIEKNENIEKPTDSIAIHTHTLAMGGLEAVVAEQANILIKKHKIVIIMEEGEIAQRLNDGIITEVLRGDTQQQMNDFAEILERHKIDVFIDHCVLYNDSFIWKNLIAKSCDVKTIAWIHNMFTRPILDLNDMLGALREHLPYFDRVVSLSPSDCIYYQSIGIKDAVYLPNPAPALLRHLPTSKSKERNKTANILWVGRLQNDTKNFLDLIPIMKSIIVQVPNAHLRIVGPESKWSTYKLANLKRDIMDAGLEKSITVIGSKSGKDLIAEYQNADIFLNTSLIEGYPLALIEAGHFGLPIVMYDLSHLVIAQRNEGIVTVPQGDIDLAANKVVRILNDDKLYETMSMAGIHRTKELLGYDFAKLYEELLTDKLPTEFVPKLNVGELCKIVQLLNFYTDFSIKRQQEAKNAELLSRDNEIAHLNAEVTRLYSTKQSLKRLAGNFYRYVKYLTPKSLKKIIKKVTRL